MGDYYVRKAAVIALIDSKINEEEVKRTGESLVDACKLAEEMHETLVEYDVDKILEPMKERLRLYEKDMEQGLLRRFPCNVGDKVWAYCSGMGILSYTVDNIIIGKEITYQCSAYSESVGDCPSECLDEIEADISEFGKTVFVSEWQAIRSMVMGGKK